MFVLSSSSSSSSSSTSSRFNVQRQVVCSSGVEKVIGLWPTLSPAPSSSYVDEDKKLRDEVVENMMRNFREQMGGNDGDDNDDDNNDDNDGDVYRQPDEEGTSVADPRTEMIERTERSMFSHDEYIDLVRTTGQSINHDYR